MKLSKEKLKNLIKEELSSLREEDPAAPAEAGADAGAGDARKALAQTTLKKVLALAKRPLAELAQKGDEIAKQEFLTILATKLGINIKDSVSKLSRLQGTQDKNRAQGE